MDPHGRELLEQWPVSAGGDVMLNESTANVIFDYLGTRVIILRVQKYTDCLGKGGKVFYFIYKEVGVWRGVRDS